MRKNRLPALVLALCIVLSMLPGTAFAFEQPPATDYWVPLTREQVVYMLSRINSKAQTQDIVLVCYPADGSAPVPTAIKQFYDYANATTKRKIYYYAFTGSSGDSSRIDAELAVLLGQQPSQWPVAVTYNTSTKTAMSKENVTTLVTPIDGPVNGLMDLMRENKVADGSSPGAPETPDNPDNPDHPDNPDPPDIPDTPDIPTPPAPELPNHMDKEAWDVLRLTNQHRMSIGREPLSVFAELENTAYLRAKEIYEDYRPDHTRPDGRICWTAYKECNVIYDFSAENIASGQTNSASVMNSWLHSPGHKRNIESPRVIHIGIGHYVGSNPSAGRHNWTQDFAASSNCRFTGLQLSAQAIYGRPGASLEELLTQADIAVTTSCYRHGTCTLPLIAAMCTGYSANASEDQTITVTYGGQTAQLTIAVRHNWSEGVVTAQPTCTETGIKTYTCQDSGCGKTFTATLPATGHNFGGGSTCGNGCGTVLETVIEEVLDNAIADTTAPPQTEEAAVAYVKTLAETVTPAPEINVVEYKAPTDTEYGYLDYTVTLPTSRAGRAGSALLRLHIPPVSDHPADIYTPVIVTFDAAGGSVTPSEATCEVDGTLSSLPTPSRNGYRFDGWYTSNGVRVTTDTVFQTNTTICAQWTSISVDPPAPVPPSSGGSSSNSNSSSNGGSYSPSYRVSVPSVSGGRLSVSPSAASVGTRVTITAIPDRGYTLAELTVKDANGKELKLTDRGNHKYTFMMPSGSTSVSAVFQAQQPVEETWRNPFADVSGSAGYYDAVKFVYQNGLMSGTSARTFSPNDGLSRAMLAQILYNKEGCPTVSGTSTFSDVSAKAWYANAVQWAAENGVAVGYGNGRFGPSDAITLKQLDTMLRQYTGISKDTLSQLDPAMEATRAQAAEMLKQYLEEN